MLEYIAVRLYNERKKDGDMNERKEKHQRGTASGNSSPYTSVFHYKS